MNKLASSLTLLASAILLCTDHTNAIEIFDSVHPTPTSLTSTWQKDNRHAFELDLAGTGIPYLHTLYRELGKHGSADPETAIFSQGSDNLLDVDFSSPSEMWAVSFLWDVAWHSGAGLGDHYHTHAFDVNATFAGREVPVTVTFNVGGDDAWRINSLDPTKWEWNMHVVGVRTPDGGSTAALLGLAIGGLFFLRRRQATT